MLYRISCKRSGSAARAEPRLGLVEKLSPGQSPMTLVGSCGSVAPGVWQPARLLELVQLCGKWKPWYLKHTYNPALDKAVSLLGEEGN